MGKEEAVLGQVAIDPLLGTHKLAIESSVCRTSVQSFLLV